MFLIVMTTATVSPTLAMVRLQSRSAERLCVQLCVSSRLTSIAASRAYMA